MTTENTYRERTRKAVITAMAYYGYDLHAWPEDVRETIEAVCELWWLKPPETKKSKAYWIASARELIDAFGELGTRVIREVRNDFERHMATHGGLPPFGVEGPNSLVKAARMKAGQLRSQGQERDRDRYVGGEYAEWIEH